MTEAQKRLRDLRDRQSKERGRMAELAVLDGLNDPRRFRICNRIICSATASVGPARATTRARSRPW